MEFYEIEIYKCTACENEDCITFTEDCGFCRQCGTPEHYKVIEND